MAKLVPHAEATAANLARVLRLHRLANRGEAHQLSHHPAWHTRHLPFRGFEGAAAQLVA